MQFKSSQFRSSAILVSAFVFTAGSALAAHHYDANKPVTLSGTVSKIEWQQPCVKIHLDVSSTQGKTTDWEIQTASPSVVESDGLTRRSINKGDQITVQGDAASNGSAHMLARSITLSNGQTIAMNASQPAGAETASNAPEAAEPLPSTASNIPLIGLIGLVSLASGALLMAYSRERA